MRQLKIFKSITNRESTALEKYLQEVGREEMITVEEEAELASRIRKGDTKAMERLVKANLRFVVSVAKQYQNQGLSLPDLINEGNLGLIKAAEKFDETRGFKFISYAVWWIRQSILQALAEQSRIVRLPLNQVGHLNRINRVFSKLEQEIERNPTTDEVAAYMDIDPERVEEISRIGGRHTSIDAPFTDGEENCMADVLTDNEPSETDLNLDKESLAIDIRRLLSQLTERERKILTMFYGIDQPEQPLEEIGNRLGLSRERVRQIKEKTLKKLRYDKKANLLKPFLGLD